MRICCQIQTIFLGIQFCYMITMHSCKNFLVIATCRSSWVEISGKKYSRQGVVILNCGVLPLFGVIHDVIMNDVHQPYLVCKQLSTICFSRHYHSYEVIYPSSTIFNICKQAELYDHSVLSLYHVHSSFFVTPKYYIVEKL